MDITAFQLDVRPTDFIDLSLEKPSDALTSEKRMILKHKDETDKT